MNLHDIQVKDFSTDTYKVSFMSKSYQLLDDMEGFIKNRNEIILFDTKNLDTWIQVYNKVKIFELTETELIDMSSYLKSKNINFYKTRNRSTILEIDENFFKLEGKKYDKLRRYKNMYQKKIPLTITTEPNSIQEVLDFIQEWKIIRKDSHFQFFTGYETKFYNDFYKKYRDNLICLYFYHENKMIGYTIIEDTGNNIYNLLFRKTNTNYINSCLYLDYYSFQYIFNMIQKTFYFNMGGDVADKKLRDYKTLSFHVPFAEVDMYDVKILKDNKSTTIKPLF